MATPSIHPASLSLSSCAPDNNHTSYYYYCLHDDDSDNDNYYSSSSSTGWITEKYSHLMPQNYIYYNCNCSCYYYCYYYYNRLTASFQDNLGKPNLKLFRVLMQ